MTAVPPTAKARATRAALVRSAGELFEESGYGAVSIRDVARGNDVTTGAIYGHFRNKADLLATAIADRIETDLEGPHYGQIGLPDYLARQARAYRSRAGLRALLVEGAHAAHIDEEAQRTIGDVLEAKLAEWRAIYRTLQDDGAFEGVDMDTLVTMLWAMEVGLGILEAADLDLPKPGAWSSTVRRLLEAIE
ncbi:MAG: helix-turn-helix domain-containing protein [Acidimicrobiia bacterium]|jgi:AcrR family transcriptional regulator